MNFENFTDYLVLYILNQLSLNIAQVSREYGFKKVGVNSLYLLTHVVRNCKNKN